MEEINKKTTEMAKQIEAGKQVLDPRKKQIEDVEETIRKYESDLVDCEGAIQEVTQKHTILNRDEVTKHRLLVEEVKLEIHDYKAEMRQLDDFCKSVSQTIDHV